LSGAGSDDAAVSVAGADEEVVVLSSARAGNEQAIAPIARPVNQAARREAARLLQITTCTADARSSYSLSRDMTRISYPGMAQRMRRLGLPTGSTIHQSAKQIALSLSKKRAGKAARGPMTGSGVILVLPAIG
jgi:hypothetical protein